MKLTLLDDDILAKCILCWGVDAQCMTAIGEAAEMIDALVKLDRGQCDEDKVIDEIADNFIMCQQMAYIFGEEKVNERIDFKQNRVKERLKKYEK